MSFSVVAPSKINLFSLIEEGEQERFWNALSGGAPVNQRNEKNETLLHVAAGRCIHTIGQFLLEFFAEVDALNSHGVTPLQKVIASSGFCLLRDAEDELIINECCEMMALLISYSANVNHANFYGITALHMAAERGSLRIVQFLLKNGANRRIVNDQGKVPFQIALENRFFSIAHRLISTRAERIEWLGRSATSPSFYRADAQLTDCPAATRVALLDSERKKKIESHVQKPVSQFLSIEREVSREPLQRI